MCATRSGWNGYLDPSWAYQYLLLNPDPKGENMRAAVVLTYPKDNIDRFEARHMLKRLKNSVAIN